MKTWKEIEEWILNLTDMDFELLEVLVKHARPRREEE